MDNNEDYINDEYDDDINYESFIVYNNKENPEQLFNIDGGDDNPPVKIVGSEYKHKPFKLDPKQASPQRAAKASFGGLIKIRNKNHKKIFIETAQKMVLKNMEIAVRCGMMMHHIVMNCINNNIAIPVFTDLGFVAKVLNYINDPVNLKSAGDSSQKCVQSIVYTS